MMQRDEEDGMRRLRRFRDVLKETVPKHGGRIVQHIGDGSLLIFESAVEAVACAQEIQLLLQINPKVPLRIGIHLGDIVMDEGQVYGDGVNLASRVESLGAPGAVLVTGRLVPDLSSHPEFKAVPLGHFNLKNVSQPVEVFAMQGDGLYVPAAQELSQLPLETQQAKSGRRTLFTLTVLAIVLGTLLWYFWPAQQSQDTLAPSIAVLPFIDRSPEGGQAYFGDGIAEDIAYALGKAEGLKVAGRASAFAFRAEDADLPAIRERLGVQTILEGSVNRQGDRVRVTAQLVGTDDGYQLWSERYDRTADDLFAIQDEIARSVANELKVLLLSDGVEQGTQNQEAYEWYLRGRHMLSQRSDGVQAATAYFQRAIAIDSNFANAYTGLGNAYLWMGWNNYLPSREAFPEARQHAKAALQLDSTLAYAHAVLGAVHLWYDWDWAVAEQRLKLALQLNPAEASALIDLGWLHLVRGQPRKAIRFIEDALEVDPLNLEYNIDLADFYRMQGKYEEARQILKGIAPLYPDNSEVAWMYGLLDYTRQEYEAAISHFENAYRLSGEDAWSGMYLAMALASAGEKAAASELLQTLEESLVVKNAAPVELAPVYWALGQESAAVNWLQRSFEWQANYLISLKVDPIWAPMREAPAVQEMIGRFALGARRIDERIH